jgi:hypothetical protein
MDRGVFNLEQFRSLLATFTDSWESFTVGADELIDAGEDVVMPGSSRSLRRRSPLRCSRSRPILKDSCTSARIARTKSSSLGRKRDVGHCASLRGNH